MLQLQQEREARRKARYRGRPERARYYKPDEEKEFEINVSAIEERRRILEDVLESIKLDDNNDYEEPILPEPEDTLVERLEIPSMPEYAIKDVTDSFTEEDTQKHVTFGEVNVIDDVTTLEVDIITEKPPPARRRQKQQRLDRRFSDKETITTTTAVPAAAPAGRMTRSRAKQLGGVSMPKRYFGEGVSESQILRPLQK